ncbi:uncharacterized protein [Triticum aestivum]|uniref:uncharacterized protein n=1 Tax=Triticum aestivum TaxID=4565 RepID=UPI001D0300CD|nr:uncharacterized protein LOC123053150 [Triticum aestivum]
MATSDRLGPPRARPFDRRRAKLTQRIPMPCFSVPRPMPAPATSTSSHGARASSCRPTLRRRLPPAAPSRSSSSIPRDRCRYPCDRLHRRRTLLLLEQPDIGAQEPDATVDDDPYYAEGVSYYVQAANDDRE